MRQKCFLSVLLVLLCLLSGCSHAVSADIRVVKTEITAYFSTLFDTVAENISVRTLEDSFAHIEEPAFVDWTVYRAYYEELTEKEKLAYRCIYNQIFAQPERIAVPWLKTDELDAVFSALSNDNPHILFMDDEAVLLTAGMQCYFVPSYTMTYRRAQEITEKTVAAARELSAVAPENATEYEVLLAAHDALLDNCVYANTDDAAQCSSALLNAEANCSGYADALKLMLDMTGVHSCVVTGYASAADEAAQSHMWLAVNTDGIWSFCDPTWDDPVSADGTQSVEHTYFCVDEAYLSKTHSDITMPRFIICNSAQTDYYRMRDLFCTADDYEHVLSDGIAAALRDGKTQAEFRFDVLQTLHTACAYLFDGQQVYVLLSENEWQSPTLVTDRIRYSANEERLILKLIFSFEE